eukprot:468912-Pleurochrysis_carterae.AAC.1
MNRKADIVFHRAVLFAIGGGENTGPSQGCAVNSWRGPKLNQAHGLSRCSGNSVVHTLSGTEQSYLKLISQLAEQSYLKLISQRSVHKRCDGQSYLKLISQRSVHKSCASCNDGQSYLKLISQTKGREMYVFPSTVEIRKRAVLS